MEKITELIRALDEGDEGVLPELRVRVAEYVDARLPTLRYPEDILSELFAKTPYTLVYEELDDSSFGWCLQTKKWLIVVYE